MLEEEFAKADVPHRAVRSVAASVKDANLLSTIFSFLNG